MKISDSLWKHPKHSVKKIKAEDAMKMYAEKYGFDFDNIEVSFESKSEFIKRYRRETKENEN